MLHAISIQHVNARLDMQLRCAITCVTASIASPAYPSNVEFVERDRQRRHDVEHVGQRAKPDAARKRFAAHAPGAALVGRVGQRRSTLSGVSSSAPIRPRCRVVATCGCSASRHRCSPSRAIFAGSLASVCSSSNTSSDASAAAARERIAAERVAVMQRAAFVEFAEERVVDLVVRERRRHRQVAAGESFAQAQKIGHDVFLLAGEHRAGAAEADGDFVGNQQHVVRFASARARRADNRADA